VIRLPHRRALAAGWVCALLIATACAGTGPDSSTAPPPGTLTGGLARTSGGVGGALTRHGTLIAGLPFSPEVDGFSFANYGADEGYPDLSPAELHRWFGDRMCGGGAGDSCTLSPPAREWMETMSGYMGGGHCEGMSSLSLLFHQGALSPASFGGPTTHDLAVEGNEPLAREIAYWWTTQAMDPTASGAAVERTPSGVIDALRRSFGPPVTETYTLGIFRTVDGELADGHSITPYAIEDMGDGTVQILVYDNNHPDLTRAVVVDPGAETWSYEASTNPAEASFVYDGDAMTKSLRLTPTSARLAPQVCPFCGDSTDEVAGPLQGATPATAVGYLYVERAAETAGVELRVTAEDGSALPGLDAIEPYVGSSPVPPYFRTPTDRPFAVTLDATGARGPVSLDLSWVGPDEDLHIDDLQLAPGQIDTAVFDPAADAVTYRTAATDSPAFGAGFAADGADYAFAIAGVDLPAGGDARISVDRAAGTLRMANRSNETGHYALAMDRIDDAGAQTFVFDDIELGAGETLEISYALWTDRAEDLTGRVVTPTGIEPVTFENGR
jgi:hypothetical protein